MSVIQIIAILFTFTAVAYYVNYRYLRLPMSIGLTLITLGLALLYVILASAGFPLWHAPEKLVESIDFNTTFINGMLSFLLFAGALHVNALEIIKHRWVVGSLATLGVLISTILIGIAIWLLSRVIGIPIDYIYCFMFGALISPTDPIAVLGVLKRANTPKSIEIKIAGESLFNDGMGIVLFLVLFGVVTGKGDVSGLGVGLELLRQLGGGIVFGLILGFFAVYFLRQVDNAEVAFLITLALVTGGYTLTDTVIDVSGVIVMVVAGLVIGHNIRGGVASAQTIQHLDDYWELIDEVLNAILFVLLAIEILTLTFNGKSLLLGLIMIPFAVLIRYISVTIPMTLTGYREYNHKTVCIMTWGGIRGGIAVALALSLPEGPEREVILMVTYVVVLFSIIIQGLTMERVVRYFTQPKQTQ